MSVEAIRVSEMLHFRAKRKAGACALLEAQAHRVASQEPLRALDSPADLSAEISSRDVP